MWSRIPSSTLHQTKRQQRQTNIKLVSTLRDMRPVLHIAPPALPFRQTAQITQKKHKIKQQNLQLVGRLHKIAYSASQTELYIRRSHSPLPDNHKHRKSVENHIRLENYRMLDRLLRIKSTYVGALSPPQKSHTPSRNKKPKLRMHTEQTWHKQSSLDHSQFAIRPYKIDFPQSKFQSFEVSESIEKSQIRFVGEKQIAL